MTGTPVHAEPGQDRGRRLTVEWIDKIIGKYRDPPIDKVIAVSRSGFTENAIRKARAANIETLALSESLEVNWAGLVNKMASVRLIGFSSRGIKQIRLRLDGPADPRIDNCTAGGVTILGYDGRPLGTVSDHVQMVMEAPDSKKLVQAILDRAVEERAVKERTAFTVEINIVSGDRPYFVDSEGKRYDVTRFEIDEEYEWRESEVHLAHAPYGKVNVAFGFGDIFGVPLTFAMTQKQGSALTFGATYPGGELIVSQPSPRQHQDVETCDLRSESSGGFFPEIPNQR